MTIAGLVNVDGEKIIKDWLGGERKGYVAAISIAATIAPSVNLT